MSTYLLAFKMFDKYLLTESYYKWKQLSYEAMKLKTANLFL